MYIDVDLSVARRIDELPNDLGDGEGLRRLHGRDLDCLEERGLGL